MFSIDDGTKHIMSVLGTIIYLLGVLASTPMVMWKTMNHQTKSFIKSCASASIMLLITAALGIYTWESPETSFRAIDTGRLRNPMDGWGDSNKISDALAQVQQRNISAVATDQDTHRVHVFTAFDDLGNPYRVGVDSFAEISLIS